MATIGIMDSGVGGLSVFREIRKLLPCADYVYYADNAWCPYGEKDPEFIRSRCREITRLMISRGAQAMVIACNTATAAAISTLRSEFGLPFIGMEPAVKPAALGTRSGVIGVLATAGTLKGSNYLKLKGGVRDGVRVVEHVGNGFVSYDNPRIGLGFYSVEPTDDGLVFKRTKSWAFMPLDHGFSAIRKQARRVFSDEDE